MRVLVRLGVAVAMVALVAAGAWLTWSARRSHTRPPERATFVFGEGQGHAGHVRVPAG